MSALPRSGVEALVRFYGADVLSSFRIQSQQLFCQHGTVSVFDHSFAVACLGLYLVLILGLRVDRRALVRGALLHDFFLYDWHVRDPGHRLHGFTHPRRALTNAKQEFSLNSVEQEVIARHMFPPDAPAAPVRRERGGVRGGQAVRPVRDSSSGTSAGPADLRPAPNLPPVTHPARSLLWEGPRFSRSARSPKKPVMRSCDAKSHPTQGPKGLRSGRWLVFRWRKRHLRDFFPSPW